MIKRNELKAGIYDKQRLEDLKFELSKGEVVVLFGRPGNEEQRLAFAKAYAFNPVVMRVDVTTSPLDRESRESLAKVIEEFAQRNIGVLIITSDEVFAQRVASKIIYLDEGEIIKEVRKQNFVNGIH